MKRTRSERRKRKQRRRERSHRLRATRWDAYAKTRKLELGEQLLQLGTTVNAGPVLI